jgi:hypothetical protein
LPSLTEGIRLAALAGAGRGEDAGEVRVRRDAQSQRGNDLAVGRPDGGDGKHGGHASAQVAVFVRQQRHAGEGTCDQDLAGQARRQLFHVAGGRFHAHELVAPRSHHQEIRVQHQEPVEAAAFEHGFQMGAQCRKLWRRQQRRLDLRAGFCLLNQASDELAHAVVLREVFRVRFHGDRPRMERLGVGVQYGLEHIGNLLFGGALHFHAQPDADEHEHQRRDQRPDPQLGAEEPPREHQDTGDAGRAGMGCVGLAHNGCRMAMQMSAKPSLKIQPQIADSQRQQDGIDAAAAKNLQRRFRCKMRFIVLP